MEMTNSNGNMAFNSNEIVPELNWSPQVVSDSQITSSKIMIFGTSKDGAAIRRELLSEDFQGVATTNDLLDVFSSLEQQSIDLLMVETEWLADEQFKQIVELSREQKISVLALINSSDPNAKQRAVELGVDDFLASPYDRFEIVSRTKNTLNSKHAAMQLANFSAQVQTDILIDPLTKVANRRAFEFELSRKVIEWQRERTPLALLMIDIDFFKRFNDQFGHQAGDFVLAQVAAHIKDSLREMDLVCRYGGEEFAAILPIKRPQESTQTAERIRKNIESLELMYDNNNLKLTVSIGVAEAMKGDDQELIVKRADTALYDAKSKGRNRAAYHDGARCVSIARRGEGEENQDAKDSVWSEAVKDDVFNLCNSRLLLVDDSKSITQVASNYLNRAGFRNLICSNDSNSVMSFFEKRPPDLLILDIEMPGKNGLEILQEIRSESMYDSIPVVVLTAHSDEKTKAKAFQIGATDFLQKPVIENELITRVTNTLLAKAHTRFIANYSHKLEQEVKIRTADLVASRREAIQCLARAAEMKDDKTGRHIIRVGKYAAVIAAKLGFTDKQVVELEHAAQLHDVGRLGLPDSILKKQDRLTDEEFDIVKDHCDHGSKIIRDDNESSNSSEPTSLFLLDSCSSSVMRMAALVAESHHEKWDGSGYPNGLFGQNIPIESRIVAVCDVFDAISNPKAYRDAFDLETCFEMIHDGAGSHFDAEVVEAFFECRHEIIQIYRDFGYVSDRSYAQTVS